MQYVILIGGKLPEESSRGQTLCDMELSQGLSTRGGSPPGTGSTVSPVSPSEVRPASSHSGPGPDPDQHSEAILI